MLLERHNALLERVTLLDAETVRTNLLRSMTLTSRPNKPRKTTLIIT